MRNLAFTTGLIFWTSLSLAAEQTIKIEKKSYSSSATLHLDIIQSELAEESAKACGSKSEVLGLKDINIQISEGIGSPVATLTRSGNDLNLNYPSLEATATVLCR